MREKEQLTVLRFVAVACAGFAINGFLYKGVSILEALMILVMLVAIAINIKEEISEDRSYENELCDLVKEMTEEFVNLIEGIRDNEV